MELLTDLLLRPAATAFLEVGVLVAVMVLAFTSAQVRYGDRVLGSLARHARLGPLVGALLGVSPGCGGALVLVPLYVRGKLSYGTIVAALVATMGDSSWVLIATNPQLALVVHLLLFVAGVVTGYAVDSLKIRPRPTGHAPPPLPVPRVANHDSGAAGRPLLVGSGAGGRGALQPRSPVGSVGSVAVAPVMFWALSGPGLLLGLPVMLQLADPARYVTAVGSLAVDPYLLLGVSGALAALVIFLLGRARFADDDLESCSGAEAGAWREVLRRSAREASFVTVWVAVAFIAWEVVQHAMLVDVAALPLLGLGGVAVAAIIGLVPGCGIQITMTGLYASGALPLPALLANAVSQDGDALIPLLALDRRAAVLASVLTIIPALAVGSAAYLILT
ncbi:MAG: putative manganese transporter [Mycobacteriales bacterium]